MGLSERQIQAVLYVKERGRISNQEHQELAGVSKRTASPDLDDLVQRGILERVGETGKETYYVLKGPQRGQRGHEGATKGPNVPGEGRDTMLEMRDAKARNVSDVPDGFKLTELGPLPEEWQVVQCPPTNRSGSGSGPGPRARGWA